MITVKLTGEGIAVSAVGVLFPWIALGSFIASFSEGNIDVGTKPLLQCVCEIYKVLEWSQLLQCYYAWLQCTASHCPDKQGMMALTYSLGTRVCSHTLHHPYSTRAFGNPPAVSHVWK